jgi:hypothetical protein
MGQLCRGCLRVGVRGKPQSGTNRHSSSRPTTSVEKTLTPGPASFLEMLSSSGCPQVKSTQYFQTIRRRPDRAVIRDEWIKHVVDYPVKETIQQDGRIRRWAPIAEMDDRYLRVILLADRETVHMLSLIGRSSHEDSIFPGFRHALYRI